MQQLYPTGASTDDTSLYDTSSVARVFARNVEVMREEIKDKLLLPSTTPHNRGIVNVFDGKIATQQQCEDLLRARNIGSEQYSNYVKYKILREPSTNAPLRKRRLLTMSEPTKRNTKRVTAKEKEMKNVARCLRQRLAWCNKEGHSYDSGLEQYSIYPRALAKFDGLPHSGSKANWTEKLRHMVSHNNQCPT